LEKFKIGGIIQHAHLARFSISSFNGGELYTELLEKLSAKGINVQFIVHCSGQDKISHFVFCVDHDDAAQVLHLLNHSGLVDTLDFDEYVASLGIYGPDFRIQPGLAARFLQVFNASDIPVQAISTSVSTLTVIFSSDHLQKAFAAVSRTFELP
jgi:aspartokinase